MVEPNILDFGDGDLVNMNWVMYTSARRKFDEETGEESFDVTFFFSDGRGSKFHVNTTREGLDTIAESVV